MLPEIVAGSVCNLTLAEDFAPPKTSSYRQRFALQGFHFVWRFYNV